MKNVMIDLETLGTRPGCQILSIGAVAFDPQTQKLGPELYKVVTRASQMKLNLHEDPATVAWWTKQSEAARQVLLDATVPAKHAVPLSAALDHLRDYLSQFGLPSVRVWGNGADFDNAILTSCYAAVGDDVPWKFFNSRCYRTLKALLPGAKPTRVGTYHNALDDAKTQAIHAIQLLRPLKEL